MKTLTFKYTKADGSVSERTLLATTYPQDSKYYAGTDVSGLDPETAQHFMARAQALKDQYIEDFKELQAKYDLKHNYRNFLASGMSDITEI